MRVYGGPLQTEDKAEEMGRGMRGRKARRKVQRAILRRSSRMRNLSRNFRVTPTIPALTLFFFLLSLSLFARYKGGILISQDFAVIYNVSISRLSSRT